MNDTLLQSEFPAFLQACIEYVGGVPEFARRFDLDPSNVHKMLKGKLRPQPGLLARLRVEEVRVYILPSDGAEWYERHKKSGSS
ncbi:MAG TPA: hypothetical protein VIC84_04835 [Blastocatellia bacterium]|jgi:hypothetical protein